MRRTWLVLVNEFRSTVGKRSFWLTSFLLPALILGISLGSQLLAYGMAEEATQVLPTPGAQPALGVVDQAGLIRSLPPGVDERILVQFPSEQAAKVALEGGEIAQYCVIPSDYLEGGAVSIVAAKFRPIDSFTFPSALAYVVAYNLTGNAVTASLLFDPLVEVTPESIAGAETTAQTSGWAFMVPYAILIIFYFVVLMGSSYVLQSMTKEKEGRTIELLLVSVKPYELMSGKVLALCAVGLLQMIIWLGGGLVALHFAVARFAPTGFQLPLSAGFVVWALLYFVFGYLLFAALLGALGALAPGTREGNQFVYVAVAPLIIPLLMSSAIIQDPNGGLSVFLSLFPLTSTVTMPTRMAAASVPLWEAAAGLVLLALSAYGVLRLAGRLVRSDTLLSAKALNMRRVLAELRAGR